MCPIIWENIFIVSWEHSHRPGMFPVNIYIEQYVRFLNNILVCANDKDDCFAGPSTIHCQMIKYPVCKMRNLHFIVACLMIMTVSNAAKANIRLPRILNSGMVLQQGKAIVLWGWADKRERIKINFAGKGYQVFAEADGRWKARLPAMDYGGPYTLSFFC